MSDVIQLETDVLRSLAGGPSLRVYTTDRWGGVMLFGDFGSAIIIK